MARIRTIKPTFWTSPTTARLSREARLLLLGLISNADDDGRFPASVPAILGAVYPYDEDVTPAKLTKWLRELEQVRIVHLYRDGVVRYGVMPTWHEHQVINRHTPSALPEPDIECVPRPSRSDSLSRSRSGSVSDSGSGSVSDSRQEGKGREGKGITPPPTSSVAPPDDQPTLTRRGNRIDPEFVPSEQSRTSILTEHPNVDLRREHAKFIDFWTAKTGKDATKLDWDATWRNWMRRAAEHHPANGTSRRQQETDDLFARAYARAEAAETPGDPVTIRGELG